MAAKVGRIGPNFYLFCILGQVTELQGNINFSIFKISKN
jgi:hypothetical protein